MDVLHKTLRQDGPAAFAFLVAEHGFSAPDVTDDGLRYSRPGLTVEINVWTDRNETEFVTTLRTPSIGGRRPGGELDALYVGLGHGPAQDVGRSATSGHTVRKRIGEHAAALAAVLADPRLPLALERTSTAL